MEKNFKKKERICFNIDQMKSLLETGFDINKSSLCWVNVTNYNKSLGASTNHTFVTLYNQDNILMVGFHQIQEDGTVDVVNSIYPAYSVQDAMTLLPYCIQHEGDTFYLNIKRSPTNWIISYDSVEAYTFYQSRGENLVKVLYDTLLALSSFIVEKPEKP